MLRLRLLGLGALLGLSTMLIPAPAAAANGNLQGVVTGPSGRAANRAVVTVYQQPGLVAGCVQNRNDWRPVPGATKTTGSTGAYSFSLAPGYYRVGVVPATSSLTKEAFGYYVQPWDSPDGSNVTSWVGFGSDLQVTDSGTTTGNIRLSTPAAISGTVYDGIQSNPEAAPAPTGKTVSGVVASAVPVAEPYYDTTGYVPSAKSGGNGRYSIRGLPAVVPDPVASTPENEALSYVLTFHDPSGWHADWLWFFPVQDTSVIDLSTSTLTGHNFVMAQTGRISGYVRDSGGAGVAGITVRGWMAFVPLTATTDSSGHFYYSLPLEQPAPWSWDGAPLQFIDPSGTYRSTFYTSNGAGAEYPADGTKLIGSRGEQVNITQTLSADTVTLTGTALYTEGAVAAGAMVSVNVTPAAQGDGYGYSYAPAVSCDGTFRFTGVWPGDHEVAFMPTNASGNPSLTLTTGSLTSGTHDLGTVELPSWIVSGTVTDGTNPVANIQVELYSSFYDNDSAQYWTQPWVNDSWPAAGAVTDASGTFKVWIPAEMQDPSHYLYLRLTDLNADPAYATQWYADPSNLLDETPAGQMPSGEWLQNTLGNAGGRVQDTNGGNNTGDTPLTVKMVTF